MSDKKEPISNSFGLLVFGLVVLTGIHWTILASGNPVLDNFPYWKYTLRFTPVHPIWIMGAFAALASALVVSYSRLNLALKLALFVVLGTVIQYSFAFSKGQGLEGIRDRIVSAGHAEFAKAAVEQPGDILWVLQNYEEVAAKKKYGYIGSKPPGTFLFYLVFEEISRPFFPPPKDHVERLWNLRTFASWTWPLISYLVVVPLYFLAREIFKDTESALAACILYLSIPSVTLITLHTDQVIYPLMAVSTVLLGFTAYRQNNFWLATLCGASLYFAVYFSFGLAVLGIFLLLPVLKSMFGDVDFPAGRAIKYGAAIILGGIFLHAIAAIFLKYDIATRYTNAWTNHLNWKAWENNLETYISAGITNTIEFSVWIGLPLTVLFLTSFYSSLRRFLIRKIDASTLLNMVLVGIFIFLLVFGKTKAETARLWLFLVPFICISVSNFINQQNWSNRGKFLFMALILLLEMGSTYFTVHYQDFS